MILQYKVSPVHEHAQLLRPTLHIQILKRRNERLDRRATGPQYTQRAVLAEPINDCTLKTDCARATIEEERETTSTSEIV